MRIGFAEVFVPQSEAKVDEDHFALRQGAEYTIVFINHSEVHCEIRVYIVGAFRFSIELEAGQTKETYNVFNGENDGPLTFLSYGSSEATRRYGALANTPDFGTIQAYFFPFDPMRESPAIVILPAILVKDE